MNRDLHPGFHKRASFVTSYFRLTFKNVLNAYIWQKGLRGVRFKITRRGDIEVSGFEIGCWDGYGGKWNKATHLDRRKKETV